MAPREVKACAAGSGENMCTARGIERAVGLISLALLREAKVNRVPEAALGPYNTAARISETNLGSPYERSVQLLVLL